MLRALYQATSAMVVAQTRQELISGNVANAESAGFKRDAVAEQVFSEALWIAELAGQRRPLGSTLTRTALSAPVTDHRQGQFIESNSPFHLAIAGQGFFSVLTPQGIRYTRAGDFRVDALGQVVDARGAQLLRADGTPLSIGGGDFSVSPLGQIQSDGVSAGQIAVTEFADLGALTRDERGYFVADGLVTVPSQSRLHQFMLEQSNVDLSDEIVDMLLANRIFQSAQRIVATYDQLMERAGEIGRIR